MELVNDPNLVIEEASSSIYDAITSIPLNPERKLMKTSQATIKDVARELGLSTATVSRALSMDRKVSVLVAEETRRRVIQKVVELDYRPNLLAQGFVTGKTDTLGLITHRTTYIEMFGNLTNQILRAAYRHDYEIVVGLPPEMYPVSVDQQTKCIKRLLSRGIDGLLINTRGVDWETEVILNSVRGLVPVVTYLFPIPGLSGVVLNDTTSFFLATEHLIGLGHERIGFLGTHWNTTLVGSAKGRGYLQAMQKYGLPPHHVPIKTGSWEPAYQLGKSLDAGRFSALVCRNDLTAMGVCRGLRESGIHVPADVSVVGYGNISVGDCFTPALTTLGVPYEAIASAAMELMLEKLEGHNELRQITLESPLIIRESCGANRPE